MHQASSPDAVLFIGESRALRVRWKRWALLGLLLLAAGATTAVILVRRPHPVITTMIRVEQPRSIFGEDRTEENGGADAIIGTYCQLILSNNVLAATGVELDRSHPGWSPAQEERTAWLRDRLRAKRIPRTWLIAISAPGLPADQQAPVLDALTDAFLRQSRLWQDAPKSSLILNLQEQHADYQKTLAERRAALREAIATNAGPEVLEPLRDAVAISEEISRRLGVAAEAIGMEARKSIAFRVVMRAGPWLDQR